MLLVLLLACVSAQLDTFAMRFTNGNCTHTDDVFSCLALASSQQEALSLDLTVGVSDSFVVEQHDPVAVISFTGYNKNAYEFEESGVVKLGIHVLKFIGRGQFFRTGNGGETFAPGYFNVSGVSGQFAGRSGGMTAINYITVSGSLSTHIVVRFIAQNFNNTSNHN